MEQNLQPYPLGLLWEGGSPMEQAGNYGDKLTVPMDSC